MLNRNFMHVNQLRESHAAQNRAQNQNGNRRGNRARLCIIYRAVMGGGLRASWHFAACRALAAVACVLCPAQMASEYRV